ncbi:hypothetical protein P152DRAFT_485311 [Eremomyces bilateralis CBS 781.70]|uniref:Uncharacterized protein n=1 Tax=Eremomyces bilateralis CBS 781.70 TaxID=1392243 RepID=A0A6G1FRZ8_9PEZI|nr:uncharacterized protein P152DRAFT_485311 [Eremomyces bilateralis CBS 781.70]KAF1808625.1 hypothetical protein P152DRAFT_485311 [Eremomyces bilateralis CBS 781.70]
MTDNRPTSGRSAPEQAPQTRDIPPSDQSAQEPGPERDRPPSERSAQEQDPRRDRPPSERLAQEQPDLQQRDRERSALELDSQYCDGEQSAQEQDPQHGDRPTSDRSGQEQDARQHNTLSSERPAQDQEPQHRDRLASEGERADLTASNPSKDVRPPEHVELGERSVDVRELSADPARWTQLSPFHPERLSQPTNPHQISQQGPQHRPTSEGERPDPTASNLASNDVRPPEHVGHRKPSADLGRWTQPSPFHPDPLSQPTNPHQFTQQAPPARQQSRHLPEPLPDHFRPVLPPPFPACMGLPSTPNYNPFNPPPNTDYSLPSINVPFNPPPNINYPPPAPESPFEHRSASSSAVISPTSADPDEIAGFVPRPFKPRRQKYTPKPQPTGWSPVPQFCSLPPTARPGNTRPGRVTMSGPPMTDTEPPVNPHPGQDDMSGPPMADTEPPVNPHPGQAAMSGSFVPNARQGPSRPSRRDEFTRLREQRRMERVEKLGTTVIALESRWRREPTLLRAPKFESLGMPMGLAVRRQYGEWVTEHDIEPVTRRSSALQVMDMATLWLVAMEEDRERLTGQNIRLAKDNLVLWNWVMEKEMGATAAASGMRKRRRTGEDKEEGGVGVEEGIEDEVGLALGRRETESEAGGEEVVPQQAEGSCRMKRRRTGEHEEEGGVGDEEVVEEEDECEDREPWSKGKGRRESTRSGAGRRRTEQEVGVGFEQEAELGFELEAELGFELEAELGFELEAEAGFEQNLASGFEKEIEVRVEQEVEVGVQQEAEVSVEQEEKEVEYEYESVDFDEFGEENYHDREIREWHGYLENELPQKVALLNREPSSKGKGRRESNRSEGGKRRTEQEQEVPVEQEEGDYNDREIREWHEYLENELPRKVAFLKENSPLPQYQNLPGYRY